jgi:DNA-binding NtrC family response regulator
MSNLPPGSGKRILLIDKQRSWRERSSLALNRAGFIVDSLGEYEIPFESGQALPLPDLVVLGCASVGPEEQELIGQVLRRKLHLLVLSTSLPWHIMRALFREGANDVTDKPYDPDLLVATVNEAIEDIANS